MRVQSSCSCCNLAEYRLFPGIEQHRIPHETFGFPLFPESAQPLPACSHQAGFVACLTRSHTKIEFKFCGNTTVAMMGESGRGFKDTLKKKIFRLIAGIKHVNILRSSSQPSSAFQHSYFSSKVKETSQKALHMNHQLLHPPPPNKKRKRKTPSLPLGLPH